MKYLRKLQIIVLSISLTGLILSCADKSQTVENQEDLLWKLEEEYIKAHKDADHSKILSMWDEKFLGWPSRLENSSKNNSGSEYLEKYFSIPMRANTKFRMEKQGIHIKTMLQSFIIVFFFLRAVPD